MSEHGIPYHGDGWWVHTVQEAKDCIIKHQERIAALEHALTTEQGENLDMQDIIADLEAENAALRLKLRNWLCIDWTEDQGNE